jgi:exoribonuclease R
VKDSWFFDCPNLKEISFWSGISVIESSAFGRTGFVNLSLPNSFVLVLNSKRKDENWHEKQRQNGKKGGRPRKEDINAITQDNPKNPWVFDETQKTHGFNDKTPKSQKTHNMNKNKNKNKNMNKNKNNINVDGSSEPPPSESQKSALELSELLLSSHRKEIPDYLSGKNDSKVTQKWALDIEKLIRIDKKPPDKIRQVILWAKTPGNFWFNNIQSGEKLRKHFERLFGQMKADGGKQFGSGPPAHRIAADNIAPEDLDKYFT